MMKEIISAMMDGELDDQEHSSTLSALDADPSLAKVWNEYHLIGDALRKQALLSIDITAVSSCRLAAEPTILAPESWWHSKRRQKIALLTAVASVSFVAILSWQPWQQSKHPAPAMAQKSSPALLAEQNTARDDLYLMAHQEMTNEADTVKVAYGNGARQ
ncbi:sigma-E factor negative regulatory protein [Neisseriaceae bacterium TC5R-5]|nr:sigma-E factor negative regulatory protein [Neisseriaceae bacterium TC5R-5]